MPLTRPKFTQVNSSSSTFDDTVIAINTGDVRRPNGERPDQGFIFQRYNADNIGIIWDEPNGVLKFATTQEVDSYNGQVTTTGFIPVETGNLTVKGECTANSNVTVQGTLTFNGALVGTVPSASKLTNARTISLNGDVTGTTTFDGTANVFASTTLASSGVTAGTYNNVATQVRPFTVDTKGRVTGVGTAVTIAPAWSSVASKPTTLSGYGITSTMSLTGDVSASSTALSVGNLSTTLSNTGVTAGTYTKLTVDAKGRVTAGAYLSGSDVTSALGFTPYNSTNPSGFQTLSDINSAIQAVVGAAPDALNTLQEIAAQLQTDAGAVTSLTSTVLLKADKTYVDDQLATKMGSVTLANVATSGQYTDLLGRPTLSSVASTGNYSDLTNKPSIPDPQVNVDWNATGGIAQILNKPATVVTSINGSTGIVSLTSISGNAGTTTKLQTPVTVSLLGDVTATSSFDGSANLSLTATLPSIVSAGTYKSVTVDAKGRVTAGTNPTTLAGYGITDSVNTSSLGVASGVATLDSSGKLTTSQIPAIVVTDTFVVASQAAMLALTCKIGDIAVRTDVNRTFILRSSNAGLLSNWQELLTPTGGVTSINGQTGAVTVTDVTGNSATATTLQTSRTISLSGGVTGAASFNGGANAVIAATVANNSHTHTSANISDATSNNTSNTIVKRDATGNFSAGVVTATALSSSGNVDVGGSTAITGDLVVNGNISVTGSVSLPQAPVLNIYTGAVRFTTGTTRIPADNSTPKNTEGTKLWSHTLTPVSSSSKFTFQSTLTVSSGTSGRYISIALFRDSTCIHVNTVYTTSSSLCAPLVLLFTDSPGSTSSVTYSLRIGISSSATWYLNTTSGNIRFNGLISRNYVIFEHN